MSGSYTKEQIEAILKPYVFQYVQAYREFEKKVRLLEDSISQTFETDIVRIWHGNQVSKGMGELVVELKLLDEPFMKTYRPFRNKE